MNNPPILIIGKNGKTGMRVNQRLKKAMIKVYYKI